VRFLWAFLLVSLAVALVAPWLCLHRHPVAAFRVAAVATPVWLVGNGLLLDRVRPSLTSEEHFRLGIPLIVGLIGLVTTSVIILGRVLGS